MWQWLWKFKFMFFLLLSWIELKDWETKLHFHIIHSTLRNWDWSIQLFPERYRATFTDTCGIETRLTNRVSSILEKLSLFYTVFNCVFQYINTLLLFMIRKRHIKKNYTVILLKKYTLTSYLKRNIFPEFRSWELRFHIINMCVFYSNNTKPVSN